MSDINYARYEGIEKLPGAIIMAAVYLPLFILNIVRSIHHPTYVLIVLSLFYVIRTTAFTLRAILAGSNTAGNNINVYIAESVIYSVGFFGLLYSAYTLVLNRMNMLRVRPSYDGPLAILIRIISNRRIIRIALTRLTIQSTTGSDKQSTPNTSVSLRKASVYIFLVITACFVLVAGFLALDEIMDGSTNYDAPVGRKYRIFVLLAIAFLCLTREAFYAATVNTPSKLLAVLSFAVSRLVPSRKEIAEATKEKTLATPSSQNEMRRFNV
ncbi:uncharacterized protein PHACADRAFT_211270 [Phanerochaete carnosa HHB-10118-sp]|uniref:Fungal pheromone STE3G-protein-coupled receptor n=1 Tax=Phanerochaete carnosa (strain HHB-10118-sp) TaxID=650164 RepID=K5WT38_PHACS|nr:uncharacterized protein PHACADRAFT_211270 [Phanerochaete carnosa HHB-10118-sp]EKM53597.1 hypothetical protein PHACADRAFT_211270 [Phanerochaete carnosa HHB-10118-sp]